MKQIIIGFDARGERAVGAGETRKQIEAVQSYACAILDADGDPLTWADFYDPDNPRSVLQSLVSDRKRRIDQGKTMADRPPFAVVTVEGRRAVRFEFYEGHDALSCVHDLRAREYRGMGMSLYLDRDPQAYDPIEYLRERGMIPAGMEAAVKAFLEKIHQESSRPPAEISTTRRRIMEIIGAEGGQTWQYRIQEASGVKSGNLATKLRAMMLGGLIEEIPDPEPGGKPRRWYRLTERGRAALAEPPPQPKPCA